MAQTIKALALSTFVGFISVLMIVSFMQIPFPGVASNAQGYAQASFFGFLAIPFSLIGLVAGILGALAGSWVIPTLRGKPW